VSKLLNSTISDAHNLVKKPIDIRFVSSFQVFQGMLLSVSTVLLCHAVLVRPSLAVHGELQISKMSRGEISSEAKVSEIDNACKV